MLLVTNEKKLSAVTDAMTASSTVPAKIPGIPTVQLSGSTLQPAAMVFRNLTWPWITFGGGNRTGVHRRRVPGAGEAAGGGLEPHDAAQRRRHPDGTCGTSTHGGIVQRRCKLKEKKILRRTAWPQHVPPPSTPRATGQRPAQTTAAEPLEEPPAILPALYGFLADLQRQTVV